MKPVFFIIIILVSALKGAAQSPNSLKGKVIDSLTIQPVAFATVSLVSTEGATIKKIATDSTGNFLLSNIPAGDYVLVFTAIGYKTISSAIVIFTGDKDIDAGIHLLPQEHGVLSTVTVISRKPLIVAAIDGFTYNAENDIIAAGSSAADLLRKIPMLTVNQDGSPTLKGSSNIKVFIDDKPSVIYAGSVADALKQVAAEDIVRVEVILYPSAKYDAEGTDGVINIITRKSRFNAVNGTLRSMIGNRNQNFTPALNIRQGNWIFNVDAGGSLYKNLNGSDLYRTAYSGTNENMLTQQSEWRNNGKIVYAGTNLMYIFNDLQTISAGYRARFNRDYTIRNTITSFQQHNTATNTFTRNTDQASGNNLQTFNIGYDLRSHNRKRQYNLLAVYFSQLGFDEYQLDQLRQGRSDYKENYRNDMVNTELALQGDYVQEISSKISWDAGIKAMFRKYENNAGFAVYAFPDGPYSEDKDRSNEFSYHRNITALYSNLSIRLKNWQVRAGGRYEQTVMNTMFKDTSLHIPNYKNLVPSILISRTFLEKHTFKWSYGKRITRPYLGTINPIINYIDSFNIQFGNPALLPEITHRYEMGYTLNAQKLFLATSFYFYDTHNGIEQVRLPGAGGIFRNTYRNIGRGKQTGVSISFNWKCNPKLSLSSTANIRYSHLQSKSLQQSNKGWQYNLNTTITYTPVKTFSAEMLGAASTPDITLQGKRDIWKYYAVILTKKNKSGKFSISARIDNFLPPSNQYMKQTWHSSLFTQTLKNRYQNQYYWLSFSCKLGKKEIKAPAARPASIRED